MVYRDLACTEPLYKNITKCMGNWGGGGMMVAIDFVELKMNSNGTKINIYFS